MILVLDLPRGKRQNEWQENSKHGCFRELVGRALESGESGKLHMERRGGGSLRSMEYPGLP